MAGQFSGRHKWLTNSEDSNWEVTLNTVQEARRANCDCGLEPRARRALLSADRGTDTHTTRLLLALCLRARELLSSG